MKVPLERNEKNVEPNNKGWTPLLFLVSFATTIGTSIPVGYCLGVTNTLSEFIRTWGADALISQYGLTYLSDTQIDTLWASIVSAFLIGGICGSFCGAWCCDKFGRRGCLLISAFLLLLGGFFFNFCRDVNSVEMLLAGRLLAGIASALIYTAHPMYLMEIAPVELRTSVGVFTAIGVTCGICVGQVVSLPQSLGTESLWQFALSAYTLLVVICFLPSYWFPESPRWLYIVKQDVKQARAELARLRSSSNEDQISLEIAEMEMASRLTNEKNSFGAVLRNKELLLPLFLVCSLQIGQQLSGINALFFYSITIFTKAGFSAENAAWMNLGAGTLNLAISSLGSVLMAKFNRRPLMLLSCTGCALSHVGLAFSLNYIDLADWLPVVCIVCMSSFIVIFQLGLGPIPYFIGSELFEVAPRPVAMSMGSLFSWSGNFMIGMFFPMLQSSWGSFAFLPCAAVCVYCLLLTWFYLPETRGRDPIDLRPIMKNGFKSKVK